MPTPNEIEFEDRLIVAGFVGQSDDDDVSVRAEAVHTVLNQRTGFTEALLLVHHSRADIDFQRTGFVFRTAEGKTQFEEAVRAAVQVEGGYVMLPKNYARLPRQFTRPLSSMVAKAEKSR